MGKASPLLRPLESQATPIRWALLAKMAAEYPGRMSSISEVAHAVAPYIEHASGSGRSMVLHSIGMQHFNYQDLYPALNAWSVSLGLASPSHASPEFISWFAEAALGCAGHAAALTEPARAVAETARDESCFMEWSFSETPEDPLPKPPEYDPGLLTAKEYLEAVGAYMAAAEAWRTCRGAVEVTARTALDKHLTWLAWAVVEGLDGPTIAKHDYDRAEKLSREADGGRAPSANTKGTMSVTGQAVNKAIWTGTGAIAQIIGLTRNPG